jgi:hypothetical protein
MGVLMQLRSNLPRGSLLCVPGNELHRDEDCPIAKSTLRDAVLSVSTSKYQRLYPELLRRFSPRFKPRFSARYPPLNQKGEHRPLLGS